MKSIAILGVLAASAALLLTAAPAYGVVSCSYSSTTHAISIGMSANAD